MHRLDEKKALVTEASRGIGRATVIALAKVGALAVVHHGKPQREAEEGVSNIRGAGGSKL